MYSTAFRCLIVVYCFFFWLYCVTTVTPFIERKQKGMDLWKHMSSSKCSFTCICAIFLPLNPSTTTVYAWSAFYPSLRFTLSLQSAFYTQSAFYPWSAVCIPQSAVCVLRWPISHTKSLIIFSTVVCNVTPALHLRYVNYITPFPRNVSLGRLWLNETYV